MRVEVDEKFVDYFCPVDAEELVDFNPGLLLDVSHTLVVFSSIEAIQPPFEQVCSLHLMTLSKLSYISNIIFLLSVLRLSGLIFHRSDPSPLQGTLVES